MILHLGVVDLPYSSPPELTKKGKRKKKVGGSTVTTGDVAGWLEDDYHVMEIFYRQHQDDVAAALESSIAGALETVLMGGPMSLNAFGAAESIIEDRFKQFLSTKEMEALGYPGVPTQAALRGVNHRMARPNARRAPRPSFIDTGLYQSSFKAWVE